MDVLLSAEHTIVLRILLGSVKRLPGFDQMDLSIAVRLLTPHQVAYHNRVLTIVPQGGKMLSAIHAGDAGIVEREDTTLTTGLLDNVCILMMNPRFGNVTPAC